MDEPEENPGPGGRGPRERRFTLLDAVVIIAALAVGQRGYMAVMSVYSFNGVSSPGQVLASIRQHGLLTLPYHVLFWFNVSAPLLLSLALTLFALRRLSPRPSGSPTGRRSGSVAMELATIGAAFVFASWGLVGYPLLWAGKLIATGASSSSQYPMLLRVLYLSMVASGASIASGWGGLLLDGGSPGKADWIEKSGRLLGTLLVLATPFYLWSALITN